MRLVCLGTAERRRSYGLEISELVFKYDLNNWDFYFKYYEQFKGIKSPHLRSRKSQKVTTVLDKIWENWVKFTHTKCQTLSFDLNPFV